MTGPTYCAQGHPFDEENTAYRANGWRYCKTCNRERTRRRTARQRDCLYPENTPQTAYKKGCRCDTCFDIKSEIGRRRSRPSPCHRCGGPKEIGGWYCDDCSWLVLVDKVTSKIEMGLNGCWIFTGTKNQGGYGVLSAHRGGHGGVAHRIMYEHFVGPIDGGLQLDHLCRVPACCNPDHLEEGTETASGWMQPKSKGELVALGNRRTNGQKPRTDERRGFDNRLERADGFKNPRSVWTIPTQGYSEAHFATWPEALVERIVKAGTSERGVCPECGAPWRREIEPVGDYADALAEETWASGGLSHGRGGPESARKSRTTTTTTTTGWIPSCRCGDWLPSGEPYRVPQPVPAVVLDPFMGSGTTALVARKLGRRSIGIELNPQYAQLCARRLQQLSLLA